MHSILHVLKTKQDMLDNQIYLSEIFTSIEGEGILFGTKTLFIRFAGCHLKCYWCDTPYSLEIKGGNKYSFSDVKKLINDNLQPNTYKVNFTGGEPLLQYNAVKELAKYIKDRNDEIVTYIESSCYDYNRFKEILPYIDICKVEFKMSDSNAVDYKHHDNLINNELECLKIAIQNKKVTYIKIVITNLTSLSEFKGLIERIFSKIDKENLAGFIIQPTSSINEPSLKQLLDFYDIVYPVYREVRVVPQLHKIIGAR